MHGIHKNICLLLTLFAGTLSGCSGDYWIAKFCMIRAEHAYTKAYELRIRKDAREKRLALYQDACSDFRRAYERAPRLFTLNRIMFASQSCMMAKDFETTEMFNEFEENYARAHPKEVEYGDAAPLMGVDQG